MDENKKEVIFPKGIYFDRPKEGAPEFIKGKIAISVDDAITFLQTYKNPRGYVNLDLKKSREGKLYLQLNTFTVDMTAPKKEGFVADIAAPRTNEKLSDGSEQPDFDQDIPF